MNIRLIVLLALIATPLLAWFYSSNQANNTPREFVKQQENPEYIGRKMQVIVYSPTGSKQYVAMADKVTYYQYDGHTDFQSPMLYLFDTNNKQPLASWHISADKAKLTKQNMLYLQGNIVVQNSSHQSKLQRIEMQAAIINLTTQDIHSDHQVKINGLNFTSTGLKLSGNLQQRVASLTEQVETYYEISRPNDN